MTDYAKIFDFIDRFGKYKDPILKFISLLSSTKKLATNIIKERKGQVSKESVETINKIFSMYINSIRYDVWVYEHEFYAIEVGYTEFVRQFFPEFTIVVDDAIKKVKEYPQYIASCYLKKGLEKGHIWSTGRVYFPILGDYTEEEMFLAEVLTKAYFYKNKVEESIEVF